MSLQRSAILVALLLVPAGASLLEQRGTSALSANPIRKVVTMLQSMQNKVKEEGEKEKELYEKFMCYCKGGGASLGNSIADANTKIPEVTSDVEEAEALKAQLQADVKRAQADKAAAMAASAAAKAQRDKEARAFASEKAEMDSDIAAMRTAKMQLAIKALEKGQGTRKEENWMAGSPDEHELAKAGKSISLLQSSTASVLRRLALSPRLRLTNFDSDMLTSFLASDASNGYVPQSGEIIGILKRMLDTMTSELADATGGEKSSINVHGELVTAKAKEIKALTKDIEGKLVRIGGLGVEIVNMKEDLDDTEKALNEDSKFLADLKANCAAKTQDWQARSKTRAEEILALADTIKLLNDDDALELFKKALPSASLVQITVQAKEVRHRALTLVQQVAAKSDKNTRVGMEFIALALGSKAVSFEKVIKMIDNMVALLGEEQQNDNDKKEYCEVQIDATEDTIKELEYKVKNLKQAIDDATTGIAVLNDEIAALVAGIQALDKSVVEATETRRQEHQDWVELMASDKAAKELIEMAKNRMNQFYNPKLHKAAPKRELSEDERITLNMGGTLAPTNPPGGISGTGVTVLAQVSAHLAGKRGAPPPPPETYDAFAKKSEESGGVIAMMDLLIADLDKEITEATTEEQLAQKEYMEMMKDSKDKRASDSLSIEEKTSASAGLSADLVKCKGDKKHTVSELLATGEYLSSLHGECDWLLKNFGLRKEARTGEIDSLKKAKAVLSGADYALLQTGKLRLKARF